MRPPTTAATCRDCIGAGASRRTCSASHTMSAYRTCPSAKVGSPQSVSFRVTWAMSWRRIENRLVTLASSDGLGHLVVDLQDQLLGAERAVTFNILTLDDRERPQDVVDVIPRHAVQKKEGSIEFGANREPALVIPLKRAPDKSDILCEGTQI